MITFFNMNGPNSILEKFYLAILQVFKAATLFYRLFTTILIIYIGVNFQGQI